MKQHLPRLWPGTDLALDAIAVALMVAGGVMLFVGSSPGLWIAVIAVGIALTAIAQADKRKRQRSISR